MFFELRFMLKLLRLYAKLLFVGHYSDRTLLYTQGV